VSFLPNPYNVRIDLPKLIYLLTTDLGKAKFFALHGFDPSRPKELDAALRKHPVLHPFENMNLTPHGAKYTIRCSLPSPDGRNPCARSVWIFDLGHSEARFVTAYARP
jgi:hypothetical protein